MKHLKSYDIFKINEEVETQSLYHYTTLSNLYLILKSNKMIARSVGDSSSQEWRKIASKSISFTRQFLSMDQLYGIQDGLTEPLRVIIYLDRDKLKQNNKIVPWSDSRTKDLSKENIQKSGGNVAVSQFEERSTQDINDIKKYITRIQIIFDDVIIKKDINDSQLKNDKVKLVSGKDDSSSELPWDEFINSEVFKKSLYSILSQDKDIRFNDVMNNLKKYTGRRNKGNIILDSHLIIALWTWWLFKKTKSLASGITFDYKDRKISNNQVAIKLSSSQQELIESLSSENVIKNFKKMYREQINQIEGSKDFEKRSIKNKEKWDKEEKEKSEQEKRNKELQKEWQEESERKRRQEYENLDKEQKRIRKKINEKLNDSIGKDESYIRIIKWWESNIGKLLTDEPLDSLSYFQYSSSDILQLSDKNQEVVQTIRDKFEQVYNLILKCQKINQINKTTSKVKQLLAEILESLKSVKTSKLFKIKKFLNF